MKRPRIGQLPNEAQGKIVQQIERGAAVEINKATGSTEKISSRAGDVSHNKGNVGAVTERIVQERSISKKKAVYKEHRKIHKKAQQLPETTRLKFTDGERADPKMTRSIRKSDKAATRFESKKSKMTPKQKRKTIEKFKQDAPDKAGKSSLSFKSKEKLPSGKLKHVLERPRREAAMGIRNASRKSDNVGLEATSFTEEGASRAVGKLNQGYKKLKFRAAKATLKAEQKAVKSNVKALYNRSLRKNPELRKANPIKKAMHKRRIKKQYARAYRAGKLQKTAKKAKNAQKAGKQLLKAIKELISTLFGKRKIIVIVIAIGILLILAVSGISSCFSVFGGSLNTVLMTSYVAEDEDILGAEEDYEAKEAALAAQIGRVETDHPGYDEYRYYIDEIGHDPHVLASYLTVKHLMYTREMVQADLTMLFNLQYDLTLTPIVEIRTRIETKTRTIIVIDPDTGDEVEEEEEYEEEVEYEYHILEVKLKNTSLGMVAAGLLDQEELEAFRVYMETQGNRPELFENNPHASRREYLKYEIPPEALQDEVFARMIAEAEKYLGWPYVWGGSSPATSFDCSGFVSWVINNSGWNVGRLGARGLSEICTMISPANARPGDLIFFNYTYAAPDPSKPTHVGIYVGNNMMIHAGNPISYTSTNTNYWNKHFYGFGRLP